MKNSIMVAILFVLGGGITGVSAALPDPYQGSDTLFNVTHQAITNSQNPAIAGVVPGTVLDPAMGPAGAYVGGGSANGQAAMAAGGGPAGNATQVTAPMTRMINSGGSACNFNSDATGTGVNDTHASGIVVGLDGVVVLASREYGAQQGPGCNLLPNGLAASGTPFPFAQATFCTVGGGVCSPVGSVCNGTGTCEGQTWKWVLAEIYGGKDLSGTAAADCNSPLRQNIVNNYQNFIQGRNCPADTAPVPGTSLVTAASVCGAGTTPNGRLWHAFRLDDASGTSEVFASVLGLSPTPSAATHNGFGDSPYCNAMNWDTRTGGGAPCFADADCAAIADATCDTAGVAHTFTCRNGTTHVLTCSDGSTACSPAGSFCGDGSQCATDWDCSGIGLGAACGAGGTCTAQCQVNENCKLGGALQWVGPGGVSVGGGDTLHRQPPPGTWGNAPPATSVNSFDVLPTQMQDNDPIRRPCLGGGTNGCLRAGEEVCNLDTTLGLVLPMVASDWMLTQPTPLKQYPTNNCNSYVSGNAVKVFTCPIKNAGKHSGECPNGDDLVGGTCSVPFDQPNNTSQCVSTRATVPPLQVRNVNHSDGRHYNVQMRDGTTIAPVVGYAQYPNPTVGNQDFAAAYYRIHEVETVLGNSAVAGCQMVDMTDQIGCLVASDPCSIGYAGNGSRAWSLRPNGAACTPSDPPICTVSGSACFPVGSRCNTSGTCVQPWDVDAMNITGVAAGAAGIQKLGNAGEYPLARKLYFSSLAGFDTIPTTRDEFKLAQNESIHGFMDPILSGLGFFPTNVAPLCEDFNEQTVCGNASNTNACLLNPAPIPSFNFTICGNGVLDTFEECDPGVPSAGIAAVNAGPGGCSPTCRCKLDYDVVNHVCK